jgi:hypothetical protein
MRRVVWSWLVTDEGGPTTGTIELEAVAKGTRITLRHRGDATTDVAARTATGGKQYFRSSPSTSRAPELSGVFQESEVEDYEDEDESHIHHQPCPESVLEEQQIDCDDHNG